MRIFIGEIMILDFMKQAGCFFKFLSLHFPYEGYCGRISGSVDKCSPVCGYPFNHILRILQCKAYIIFCTMCWSYSNTR